MIFIYVTLQCYYIQAEPF